MTTCTAQKEYTGFTSENAMPDQKGYFGEYGGAFIPPQLAEIMTGIEKEYYKALEDDSFIKELDHLRRHYVGRPSPVYFAKSLSEKCNGADIYFKREDLNHTGAHKINHCLGEALLAKRLGAKRIMAETGAGQHGVALATAAALVGLECHIYMGEVDIAKEHPNVVRMKILGAEVIPVKSGLKTLKEAVDECFVAYLQDPVNQFYAIGSVVGPHPFPMMVRDFQRIVGIEAREQFLDMTGGLPDALTACVGGGSNAIGLFSAFFDDPVEIYGVEPSGIGFKTGEHAATLTFGSPGVIHGFKCHLLQDDQGNPAPVYSVASGLDYPGIGPQHSFLKDSGRVNYDHVNDQEAIDAFFELSRVEGIIPALESSHAAAFTMKLAKKLGKGKKILMNLSGRGDKDIDFVAAKYGKDYGVIID